jgi:hypothetical protein
LGDLPVDEEGRHQGATVFRWFIGERGGELLPVLYRVHFGLHAVPYAVVPDGVGRATGTPSLWASLVTVLISSGFSSVCVRLSPSVRP